MSVQVKEKKVSFNDCHFYRASPFVHQGYIPTVSLKNRKQPQFMTQIPQGIDYFESSAKKHFTQITKKSLIADQNLFSNPEKFPLENTLANHINYDRQLSTIDIEGANANSRKSMALKNRIKAQQELIRRKAPIITPILAIGLSEEELRRKLAQEQLENWNSRQSQIKNSHRKYHSERKLAPPEHYIRSPYVEMKDEEIQLDLSTLQKELQKQQEKQEQELTFNSNPQIVKYDGKTMASKRGRYQTQQNIYKLIDSPGKVSSDRQADHGNLYSRGSELINQQNASSSKLNEEIKMYLEKERRTMEREIMTNQMKQQHRQINPTNLSYQGSIVRNSNIFKNLGKNLTLQ